MSDHKLAFGHVGSNGNAGDEKGFTSWSMKDGKYALRFQESGLLSVPAVIVTPATDDQRAARLNALDWGGDGWASIRAYDQAKQAYDTAVQAGESAADLQNLKAAMAAARAQVAADSENRTAAVRVDTFNIPVTKSGRTPSRSATPFHALAIARSKAVDQTAYPYEIAGTKVPDGTGDASHSGSNNTSTLIGDDGVQVAAGIIKSDRTALVAYGCSSDTTQTEAGKFVVKFSPAFTAEPTVVASIESGDSSIRTLRVDAVSKDSATILISDKNVGYNVTFHFIAVGPGTPAPNRKFVYGVVERENWAKDDKSKDFMYGDGFKTENYVVTARYPISFTPAFQSTPVVVGCTEHVFKEHIRQLQVSPYGSDADRKTKARFEVIARSSNTGSESHNTCRFNFLAYSANG